MALQSTPLLRSGGSGEIDPSRLFVRSQETLSLPDAGAGPGFVPLDRSTVVALGPAYPYATPLDFRLLTDWGDRPGDYGGTIVFSALVQP